ncbi:uncharacterized protein LOC130624963 [Hydractinia symbiolongicarpus]|uniref:uncharacterized protein LOC130624963 n=1 Tax=Hydractinia symbiolongicarpus TaxID=13093 RepID=UPI00254E033D|nr:uncharacterized protein LOC130624963 [Hydractinia symbiolongicarpus]
MCSYRSLCCFEDDQVGYKCIPNQFKKISPWSLGAYPAYSSYPASRLQDGISSSFAGTHGAVDSHFSIDLGMEKPVRFVTINLQSTVSKAAIRIDTNLCSDVPEVANVEFVVECNSYLSGRHVIFFHQLDSPQSLYAYEMHVYGDA